MIHPGYGLSGQVAYWQILVLVFAMLPHTGWSQGVSHENECAETDANIAVFVSVTGNVNIYKANGLNGIAAKPGDCISRNATITTYKNSKAVIRLLEDDTQQDPKAQYVSFRSVIRSSQMVVVGPESSLRLLKRTSEAEENGFSPETILEKGLFFWRAFRKFRFQTPHANGGVEGTEFTVEVNEDEGETTLSVFEGEVFLENSRLTLSEAANRVVVRQNNFSTVRTGKAPSPTLEIKTRNPNTVYDATSVYWAVYYPPVFDVKAFQSNTVKTAVEMYLEGSVVEGITLAKEAATNEGTPEARTAYAALLLGVGRLAEAEKLLGITCESQGAYAQALTSIIRLAQSSLKDAEKCLKNARAIATVDARQPDLIAVVALAESYLAQVTGDFDTAINTLTELKSSTSARSDATIAARLTMLHLMNGDIQAAQELSSQRLQDAIDSETKLPASIIARAWIATGFVALAGGKIPDAQNAFEQAIQNDASNPQAHLGYGRAAMRIGDEKKAARALFAAVILDPTSSELRSQLARLYFSHGEYAAADEQIYLAARFDRDDPTPDLYKALVELSHNQAGAALMSLQDSIRKNDNRSVLRSRSLLDRDMAGRISSVGKIYRDLSINDAAIAEASHALQVDRSSFAAHRLMADSLATTPGTRTARSSELLQAQLRQPLLRLPADYALGDSRLRLPRVAALRGDAAIDDYSQNYTNDGASLRLSGRLGSNSLRGGEVTLSWLKNPFSISYTSLRDETDGFRHNADRKINYQNISAHVEVSDRLSWFLEYKNIDDKTGDTYMAFDPADFNETARSTSVIDTYTLGLSHQISSRHGVTAFVRHETADISDTVSSVDTVRSIDDKGTVLELQHLYANDTGVSLESGFSYLDQSILDGFTEFGDQLPTIAEDREAWRAYTYAHIPLGNRTSHLSMGLSWTDVVSDALIEETEELLEPDLSSSFNYKLGIVSRNRGNSSTHTFRAAAFSNRVQPVLGGQTLEPTTIAGFVQQLDRFQDTELETVGFGYDWIPDKKGFRLGLQVTDNELNNREFDEEQGGFVKTPGEEHRIRFYAAKTFSRGQDTADSKSTDTGIHQSLKFRPEFTVALNMDYIGKDGPAFAISDLTEWSRTRRVSLSLQAALNSNFGVHLRPACIRQEGSFYPSSLEADFIPTHGKDTFCTVDLGGYYLLPNRRGEITLELTNVFDKSFSFQDDDPTASRYIPERRVQLLAKFSF